MIIVDERQIMDNKAKTWQPPEKIWNIMFIGIFFANMAMNLGQQMSNSMLSLYARSLDAPADQIGQLMSMFAVTALIFRFVSGPAMNAYNRKYLLAFASVMMGTAYLGFSLSPTIAAMTGGNVISIMKCFRLIQGIGNAFGNSCCMAIVADVLPKDRFSSGMGYYACAQVVSQAIGPTVGIVLRDLMGYQKMYILFAGIMMITFVIALCIRIAPRERIPFNLKPDNMIAKEALAFAGVTFLIALAYTSVNAFLLVYAEERGITGSSWFFTVYCGTMLLTRPFIGKMTEKYGFAKVGVPCALATALSLAMIGFSKNLPMLLFAAIINAFGYGGIAPMLQSLCLKAAPMEKSGSAASTYYIGLDSATIVGPVICGMVANVFGYTERMWLTVAAPCVLGALAIFLIRGKIGRIEKAFLERQ